MGLFKKPEIRITGYIEFPEGVQTYERDSLGWTPDPTPELLDALNDALRRAAEAELELARMARSLGYCPWPGGGGE